MANGNVLPAGAPAPRLCHLVKWEDHDEFGFNLHAEKAKLGQYIGKVDEDSPAFYAGLLEGDRIVEVNDVNISNENHKQVVARIKSIPNETRLLVVDEETDRWYKEKKLIVKGTQANVIYQKTPEIRPSNQRAPSALSNNTSEDAGSRANSTKSSIKDTEDLSSEAPAPRLCHVVKWPDYEDYGFNLHADMSGGQFVGKVDLGTPADLAGLREGDRIVEVNGEAVSPGEKQLVDRIKAVPGEAKLLVLDATGERWYRERGLIPRSTQPNVIYRKTPPTRPQQPTSNGSVPKTNGSSKEGGEEQPPAPRLCHLFKWPDFQGYGFTMHADKQRSGQYVGKVDPDSPAELAGLMEGDRIVEVNGVQVAEDQDYLQLVERIKSLPGEARLLVVDPQAERWYRERRQTPSSAQPNVIVMRTPVPRPTNTAHPAEETPRKTEEASPVPQRSEPTSRSPSPPHSTTQTGSVHDSPRSNHSGTTPNNNTPPPPPNTNYNNNNMGSASVPPAAAQDSTGLNLNMTASEMRQLLASRKKYDPKKVQMDMRDKYNIIKEM